MKKFKNLFYAVSLLFIGGVIYSASNDFTDIQTWKGNGTLNNNAVMYLDGTYGFYHQFDGTNPDFSITGATVTVANTILSTKSILFGSYTAAVSTSNTSGASSGLVYNAFLAAGALDNAVTEGDVICVSTPNIAAANQVTVKRCEGTAGLTTFVGISVGAASTGTLMQVFDRGWVQVKSTGSINAGDLVQVSSFPGIVMATVYSTSAIGVAFSPQTAIGTGGNRIRIKLR